MDTEGQLKLHLEPKVALRFSHWEGLPVSPCAPSTVAIMNYRWHSGLQNIGYLSGFCGLEACLWSHSVDILAVSAELHSLRRLRGEAGSLAFPAAKAPTFLGS